MNKLNWVEGLPIRINMINTILKSYKHNGSFVFNRQDQLVEVCNAPRDESGVYLIYSNDSDHIIYIGSSGKMHQNGKLKTRPNGIWARLVNGKEREKPRQEEWPRKMGEANLNSIRIEWYITFNEETEHIPLYVESMLLQKFYEDHKRLPIWNKVV